MGAWVLGNAGGNATDLDLTNITAGTLYLYTASTRIYRCPADQTKLPAGTGKQAPAIRSYAICAALNPKGGYYGATPFPPPWIMCEKLSSILAPGASDVWVFNEPNAVSHDVGFDFIISQAPDMKDWAHLPTDRHNGGCNLSFVDGHVLAHKWKAAKENRKFGGGQFDGTPILKGGDRDDFNWLFGPQSVNGLGTGSVKSENAVAHGGSETN